MEKHGTVRHLRYSYNECKSNQLT